MTRPTAAKSEAAQPSAGDDVGPTARGATVYVDEPRPDSAVGSAPVQHRAGDKPAHRNHRRSTATQATAVESDTAEPGALDDEIGGSAGVSSDDSDRGAELGVPDSGTADSGGTRSSVLTRLVRRGTVLAALTVLALAGLSVAGIALFVAHRDSDRADTGDLALLGAVRGEVVNLISPSVKDPVGSTDRIAADATGEWLTEFQGTKDKFVGAINDSKTDSVGQILGAGVERHNPDGSTTVLVSAVSKVTNSAGAKDDPRTWRLRVDVARVGGAYKLAKVEVVP